MTTLSGSGLTRLATSVAVDFNTASAQPLYTVPPTIDGAAVSGCIPTHIVPRAASTSLTTAEFSVGWTGPNYDDVVVRCAYHELIDATLYTPNTPDAGGQVGLPGDVLYLHCEVLQGAASTGRIDVFGYLV